MKYKVNNLEAKQSAKGTTYYIADFTDEAGNTVNASTFDSITNASEVEGEITKNGQYTNFKLGGAKKGGVGIKAAQERKAEMIEKAQDRKNEAIAFFNATNNAIALINTLGLKDKQDIKDAITYWREWFLDEWIRYEAQDYTNKHQPF